MAQDKKKVAKDTAFFHPLAADSTSPGPHWPSRGTFEASEADRVFSLPWEKLLQCSRPIGATGTPSGREVLIVQELKINFPHLYPFITKIIFCFCYSILFENSHQLLWGQGSTVAKIPERTRYSHSFPPGNISLCILYFILLSSFLQSRCIPIYDGKQILKHILFVTFP